MEETKPCGCPDFDRSLASRRGFLKGLGVLTAGGVMSTMHGTVFRQTAFAASGQSDNVLVVLSLRGGADGLSLVVPYADPAYYKVRKTINIPKSQVLVPNGTFGLHPNFASLAPLWKAGTMAAVQAVGLPQPNRSHFSATEEVEDADPGSTERIGWINRLVGMSDPQLLFAAVEVGNAVPETEISGPQPTLATTDIDNIVISGPVNGAAERRAALDATWGSLKTPLGKAVRDGMSTADQWGPVLKVPQQPQHGASYPSSDLGDALAQSARLIRADVGAQTITVDHGSWDMHTDLGTLDVGLMRGMVSDLSDSLSAFFTDLGTLADHVTVVTISEFGRRVAENGDAGLDHGYGNAMLLLGAGVKGGTVYGSWPGLSGSELKDGDLDVTRDYRSVLTEVVRSRFPDVSIPTLFPGFKPEKIGVMRTT
jgi:uncharacterized protein (DUF1501 family)